MSSSRYRQSIRSARIFPSLNKMSSEYEYSTGCGAACKFQAETLRNYNAINFSLDWTQ